MFKTIDNVDNIIEQSRKNPVFIYKFSTTCGGCSPFTKAELEDFMKSNNKFDFYIIPIQNERNTSDKVAQKLNVNHQSPQLIFIKNGEVLFDLDHWDINQENIKNKLREIE